MAENLSIVMIGATGAVGTQCVIALAGSQKLERLTLLGRRAFETVQDERLQNHVVDVLDPATYREHLSGHDVAICTLGVGQPTKTSREDFLKIDRDAVLDFATACKEAGVRHFQLLGSVGADPRSPSFFLRSKGQLEQGIRDLGFQQVSFFQPSMILTPQNRYGLSQALTLKFWPILTPILMGPLRKLRGIPVGELGRAIALNSFAKGSGARTLQWDDIKAEANAP